VCLLLRAEHVAHPRLGYRAHTHALRLRAMRPRVRMRCVRATVRAWADGSARPSPQLCMQLCTVCVDMDLKIYNMGYGNPNKWLQILTPGRRSGRPVFHLSSSILRATRPRPEGAIPDPSQFRTFFLTVHLSIHK
jgi:hypothetical protein